MKKAIKAGPAKTAPAKQSSAMASPRGARGQTEMMAILERLAQNTERLARAAERLEAAMRPVAAQQSEQPGEVVNVVVVEDDSDDGEQQE